MGERLDVASKVEIAPGAGQRRARPSWQARTLDALLRVLVKRRLRRLAASHADIAAIVRQSRERMERYAGRARARNDGVLIGAVSLGGVPVEVLSRDDAGAPPVVLYLHGGAFVMGSPRTHRTITRHLAAAGAQVFAPDYRLAPEHPYPAALDDALAVYRALLERKIPPSRIVLAGDSAGGNLAFALLHRARALDLPLPAGVIGLSPWTDLSCTGESLRTNTRHEAMLPAETIGLAVGIYADGLDLANPGLSPLFGDFAGMPPMLVQVGSRELLFDDAARVVARAQAAGVAAELAVWDDLPHVFQAFGDFVPEARDALDQVMLFLRCVTHG